MWLAPKGFDSLSAAGCLCNSRLSKQLPRLIKYCRNLRQHGAYTISQVFAKSVLHGLNALDQVYDSAHLHKKADM